MAVSAPSIAPKVLAVASGGGHWIQLLRVLPAFQGAQLVFHPHFDETKPGAYQPSTYADPANTFHEKAALCRAAENTCFFATVNCASRGSRTTSAVVRPDGTLLTYQPYGQRGVLIADIDLTQATGLLAKRHKPI